ncbi:MAG: S1C family serine protease, partial [Rhodospirillaceae bacterium]
GLDGKLVGVGSLFVGAAPEPGTQGPGNMFVPIDLLKPIMATMIATGRSGVPPRPWLGVYPAEAEGRVFVSRVSGDGPGAEAGLKPGDIIVGVKGRRVSGMADFYRKVWAEGAAGIDVALDVLPMGAGNLEIKRVTIYSRDRHQWLQLRRE